MRVLVVDPNKKSLKAMNNRIQALYPDECICIHSNPIEAWKDIITNGIDVLFTKIDMPQYSGYELASMAKKRNKDVKVSFVSANGKEVIG
ncbi:MAG: response regulator [Bacilli bacterium]|nr:response regulator [Bacilli bacterium]